MWKLEFPLVYDLTTAAPRRQRAPNSYFGNFLPEGGDNLPEGEEVPTSLFLRVPREQHL